MQLEARYAIFKQSKVEMCLYLKRYLMECTVNICSHTFDNVENFNEKIQ